MEFSIKSGSPEKQRSGCVVVGVYEGRKLTASAQALDAASGGYLSEVLRRGDLEGAGGRTLLLHNVPQLPSDRVLLVGLGRERDFGDAAYRGAMMTAAKALRATGTSEASVCLTDIPVKRRETDWKVEQAVLIIMDASYRFDRLKSKPQTWRLWRSRLMLSSGLRRWKPCSPRLRGSRSWNRVRVVVVRCRPRHTQCVSVEPGRPVSCSVMLRARTVIMAL